jgi:hypothetical protein
MTRYTVVWPESLEDELAEVWLESTDRNEVTSAVASIDKQLAVDATEQGDELSEGLRALLVPPLKVLFTVRESDRIVEVVRVRRV